MERRRRLRGGECANPLCCGLEGFSLVEIMVTITLLAVIILGLFSVFNQTQRAFRSTMNQSDTLEAGRAFNDQLGTEVEQTTPSYFNAVNFYAAIFNSSVSGPNDNPLIQTNPPPSPPASLTQYRTNYLEDFFMLTRNNRTWVGIGYCVRTNDAQGRLWYPEIGSGQAGAGSLYRYSSSVPVIVTNAGPTVGLPVNPFVLYNNFIAAAQPGSTLISNRVCDGVVHFRVRAFDTNGVLIVNGSSLNTYIEYNSPRAPGEVWSYAFYTNAVPAFVETELGLLEPRSFTRFTSIGDPAASLRYITRDDITAHVQLFRHRIAIQNVDPLAFQ